MHAGPRVSAPAAPPCCARRRRRWLVCVASSAPQGDGRSPSLRDAPVSPRRHGPAPPSAAAMPGSWAAAGLFGAARAAASPPANKRRDAAQPTAPPLASAQPLADAPPRPLAINAQLALYRAREALYEAGGERDGSTRRALRARAATLFARAVAYDPTEGRGYLGLAQRQAADGDVHAARATLEKGTAALPDNAFLWQAWAVLEERAGDLGRARVLYDAATVADKRHAAAWHGWGQLEKRAGNAQRARDLFTTGLRMVPDGESGKEFLHQSLGLMAAERGRLDEARGHFAAGVRSPWGRKSAALWQAWAVAEARAGDAAKARPLFRRALAAAPKNRHAWLGWAVAEAGAGEAARARALFRAGACLNPRDAPLLQAWARHEAACGRLPEARVLFERAAAADASHAPVWTAWGVAEAEAGNRDAARSLFQRGAAIDPQSPNAARCFQAWGCLEAREALASDARLTALPAAESPAVAAREAAVRSASLVLARRLFKCALRADPGSAPTWLAWAETEEALGNATRGAELRSLCLQQRAEEVVGADDGAPAELLRPLFERIGALFSPPRDAAPAQQAVAGAAAQLTPQFAPAYASAPPASSSSSSASSSSASSSSATLASQPRRAPAAAPPAAAPSSSLFDPVSDGTFHLPSLLSEPDAARAAAAARDIDAALAAAAHEGGGEAGAGVAGRIAALIARLDGGGRGGR